MSDPLDVARNIFMNDEGELRCGWRVLAFVAIFIIAEALLFGMISAFATLVPSLRFVLVAPSEAGRPGNRELISLGVDNLRNLAAAVVATAFCARLLERRSLASVGFKLHHGWPRDLGLGT